jgi:2-hydroxychromene-2-carboxylate isomerase
VARVTWYFDFISPYAYLGLHTLGRLPPDTELLLEPILLAGLLKHWGQKGPAEVPPKRTWTYRSCIWLAKQQAVPFQMPAAHPFNPLPYLRLAIAAGSSAVVVSGIFRALWTTGVDPADPDVVATLAESLGVATEKLGDASVKDALRDNTERAISAGVFGVPSFAVATHVFWGSDSVDFAAACLEDPGILETAEMRRAATLPIGASRRASS